ncbi:hypothetical protein DERF_000037 [Dermatophagoides farinae]|uniref:Uncharacterized protein n=1 Tax=Dermatophagoides farinae TaxID=6954 RepID=A0A922I7T5_DERFA|nr:hypothetical protein DERF_000037 [Dermatophagoides farinae]
MAINTSAQIIKIKYNDDDDDDKLVGNSHPQTRQKICRHKYTLPMYNQVIIYTTMSMIVDEQKQKKNAKKFRRPSSSSSSSLSSFDHSFEQRPKFIRNLESRMLNSV